MFRPHMPPPPPLPPIAPDVRVDVVDASNPDRLLGTLPRSAIPHGPAKARAVVFAIMPKLTDRDLYASPSAPLNEMRIALEFGERVEDQGFVIRAVLKTTVCQSELVKIRGFRFPKETAEEAAYRLRYL